MSTSILGDRAPLRVVLVVAAIVRRCRRRKTLEYGRTRASRARLRL